MPETALPNAPAGRKTHQAKPPGKVHLPELDTPQNAEAVMVAHVHGQERLVVLGDNGSCKIYNLDFPDVIALRNELLPAGKREESISCDLNNTEWFKEIDASGGALFFASGVFYYFLTEQVKALVQKMADAFPGGVLVFDAANRTAVKMIAKTWLKSAKIKDVGAYFAVSDAKSELSPWDSRLQVTSRGYMLGYNDLRDPSVSGFFRFLAKVGDGMMKMQIVKIGFGGRK
jgi:hypothetical protein